MTDPTCLAIRSDTLAATISTLGAEVQDLTTAAGDNLMWTGDANVWSGRSPILFPIVGRAPDNRITIGDYSGPMPKHGFARGATFDVVTAEADRATLRLEPTTEIAALWPFDFRFDLLFAVQGNRFSVTARILNRSATEMPFSLGFHPAFKWPLPGGTGETRISLAGASAPPLRRIVGRALAASEHQSPFQDGQLRLHPDQFVDDAMIFHNWGGTGLTLQSDSGPRLTFDFTGLPDLGIWSKPGAAFVCIEPWHGTDALQGKGPEMADRPGIVRLAAGQSFSAGYSVTVD